MSVKPVRLINPSPHHHQYKCRTPPLLYSSVICLMGLLLLLQPFSAAMAHVKAASAAVASEAVVAESSQLLPVSCSLLHDCERTRPSVMEQSVVAVTTERRLLNVNPALRRLLSVMEHFTVYRCGPVVLFVLLQITDMVANVLTETFGIIGLFLPWFFVSALMAYLEPVYTDGTLPWISSKSGIRNFFKNMVSILFSGMALCKLSTMV
eukprot:GHVQ01002270.1.p1 GENE.GHVQ01002270.1~~GHVQ01002270.1.p1  ORF type:complete len:208 (+),score=26.03 GHVQ01002270.1:58-681(+)